MEKFSGLSHLYATVFLHNFAALMVLPTITDVTMAAFCPGQNECSVAIYLSGFQQAITGLGSLVMMPLMGNLSDKYGRKALLTVPLTLTIFPLAILAYSRTRSFFYAYYVLKTVISIFCEGSVHCLALAYVADNAPEARRGAAFGVLSGIGSCAFVCGNVLTRFLSTSSTFKVSASMAVASTVYQRIFLPDSKIDGNLSTPIMSMEKSESATSSSKDLSRNPQVFKPVPSMEDVIALLKTSLTFTQLAIISFFSNLADVGLYGSMLYYFKAKFHFNKDQFADIMVISGIGGAISQIIFMPLLAPILGESRLLSIGLFFASAHMFLYSIAWSSWVPYMSAMLAVFFVLSQPCIRSIVSRQVGSYEQGKAQGIITGIGAFANVISPLVFSPLTALFLSERAPFDFPGFSIMCVAFTSMIAFTLSLMIKAAPQISDSNAMDP